MRAICTYDDFAIYEHEGKQYVVQEVKMIDRIYIDNQTEHTLLDSCREPYDFSGELDHERTYCFWQVQ